MALLSIEGVQYVQIHRDHDSGIQDNMAPAFQMIFVKADMVVQAYDVWHSVYAYL